MDFSNYINWTGTAEDLESELKLQIFKNNLNLRTPIATEIRIWRLQEIFSENEGEEFKLRDLLESLIILDLLSKTWSLAEIEKVLPSWSNQKLKEKILNIPTIINFKKLESWNGTAEDLQTQLEFQIYKNSFNLKPPTTRTIRLWRSHKIFSQDKGQKFEFRQLLEALVTLDLLAKGWSLKAIADILNDWNDQKLKNKILNIEILNKTINSKERPKQYIARIAEYFVPKYHGIFNSKKEAQEWCENNLIEGNSYTILELFNKDDYICVDSLTE